MIAAIESAVSGVMTPAAVAAAKYAASVTAMNNVYYRFVHLASNPEYKTMPARLRMNARGHPGVDRADFELWALTVSAINGCGACMDAHEKALRQSGVSSDAIHTAVRFAAIVQSVRLRSRREGVARHKRRSNPPSPLPSPCPSPGQARS